MRFAVPQFIDVEDKIFGPLTLKQAIYVGGGGGVVVALFVQFGFFIALVIGGPVAILAIALAFFKINNRPFYLFVYAAIFYLARNKLYLWKNVKKRTQVHTIRQNEAVKAPSMITKKISSSRLKELAWSLDTGNSMYTKEEQWK